MIEVTVTLVPWGDRSKAEDLCVVQISNDGTGNDDVGNYNVAAHTEHGVWKGQVTHNRTEGFLPLMQKVFNAVEISPNVERRV
jgi:hypothetical protein